MLDRRIHYFALLILTILSLSSFYLSWSADLGLGELTVERLTIENTSGRTVDFLVYTPRSASYYAPIPAILTIHGIAGSKEGMYSFNIELARRNFTVVSVDLAGHGDSAVPFSGTDYQAMAEECYAALRYVQLNRSVVDDTTYGVLAYSLGYEVAARLSAFPITPKGYAAVGWGCESDQPPGNLMIALGQFDELVSVEEALSTIRKGTGNESAEIEVTYGSFANQTAYRVSTAIANHVSEPLNPSIVAQTLSWLVQAVQGESHLTTTLDVNKHVYTYKTIGAAAGALGLLVSIIPLVVIIRLHMPVVLKPGIGGTNFPDLPLKRTLIVSSILGIIMPLWFATMQILGFYLEETGFHLISSMSATGILVFLISFPLLEIVIIRLTVGRQGLVAALAGVGFERRTVGGHIAEFSRIAILAALGICWLIGLFAVTLVSSNSGPWVTLLLVRFPTGPRILNMVILVPAAFVFFAGDAAWIRSVIICDRSWNGKHVLAKSITLVAVARLVPAGLASMAIMSFTTAEGFVSGPIVVLGLVLLLFYVVSILTTTLIALISQEFGYPLPEAVLSAFILCWAVISSVPLI